MYFSLKKVRRLQNFVYPSDSSEILFQEVAVRFPFFFVYILEVSYRTLLYIDWTSKANQYNH